MGNHDILLRFVGLNWLAETKTERAGKFLLKVRFAIQDKRYEGIYTIPNNRVRTFMSLASQHRMSVHQLPL